MLGFVWAALRHQYFLQVDVASFPFLLIVGKIDSLTFSLSVYLKFY